MRYILIFASIIGYIQSLTDEEVKISFTKNVMKCVKDHPVDMEDLDSLQKFIMPKKYEVKCLLACAYKLEGLINDKGMYDIERAYKVAELAKNGDEKRLINGKKLVDICAKANDETVSDGDKGCERAALIFKYTVENAPKLGFKI